MYVIRAYDKNGTMRVWGGGTTPAKAKEQCQVAVAEYLKERPDLGPSESFHFGNPVEQ